MLAATRLRQPTSPPRRRQPIAILSRSNVVLPTSFTTGATTLIAWERMFVNPQDGRLYATYATIPGNKFGVIVADSPDGPWTDLGFPAGLPSNNSVQQHFVMLGPDNKWAWYSVTSITNHVGTIQLYQTAAGAAITSTYTQTSASLLPLGTLTTDPDYGRISEPFVFQDQSATWRMLFMIFNNNEVVEQVGMATSSGDHTGPWTKYASNPIIANPASGYDQGANCDPSCFYYNGLYYILTSVGASGAPQGSNELCLALVTTPDFVTFTKRGVIVPLPTNPAAPDRSGSWAGKFWWKGLRADDYHFVLPTSADTIYWTYFGATLPQGVTGKVTQGMLGKLDPQSIFDGTILTNPWSRLESTSASPSLVKTGTWTTASNGTRGYSGGDYIFSANTGDSQTLTWTGQRARVCLGTNTNQGIADIYLDGVKVGSYDGFDSTADTVSGQWIAWDTGDLPQGQHTLRVVVSGAKNASSGGTTTQIDYWEFM